MKNDNDMMVYTQERGKTDKKLKQNENVSESANKTLAIIAYNTKDVLTREEMKSSDVYLMTLRFYRNIRKYLGFYSSDEEICTNTVLLIHKDDTTRDIWKRVFQTLIACFDIPSTLIKYDLR